MGMLFGTWKVRSLCRPGFTEDSGRKFKRVWIIFRGSAGGPGIVISLVDAVSNFGDSRVIGELKINWK
jgi:hypothetical protein